LAVLLAFARPPAARAVVELGSRHGPDGAQLGRALGMSPARAAARATEVGAEWDAALDPVVLAFLGRGECPEFPDGDPLRDGLDGLVGAGPAVAAHANSCELCGDRRRAMVSVRQLLAQRPLEPAPPSVTAVVRSGPRLPVFNAPPLD